ncbi:zf-ZPR1-domain-containing protein [Aureobasidium pullulans]|uniref:Zf-ZPR1-domain-containing protein n=1 Tax=Aureobasidium pullulans TaxID=5580 RepID=A0A4S9LBV3_AURPU|nr:zf-ZPR1-domain-containing protein [Aureobasidium pullulans]
MAANDKPTSVAKDLFEDMGRQVEGMKANTEDGDDQRVVDEIESLCMNCHADGMTRLLLTRIPYFREIVLSSFYCPHCSFKNTEISSAGQIQERGSKYVFKVENADDFQRSVVKGDGCAFRVEDIDLEIPQGRGQMTNIEGILAGVKEDLSQHQEARMQQMPEAGAKVAEVIQALGDMLDGKRYPFTVSAEDPSGNSFIQPSPTDARHKYTRTEFDRTPEQNAFLGIGEEAPADDGQQAPETNIRPEYRAADGLVGGGAADAPRTVTTNNVDEEDIRENEVYSFPASCPGCTRHCTTNMKMVNIPFFKQVVLMSTVCEHCGYRSNEVKTGGEVPEKGSRITLAVNTPEDLARDVLKSESAALYCPELQLRVEPGTQGGRFTTVEGLLTNFRKDLRAQAFGLENGDDEEEIRAAADSMQNETKRTWEEFFTTLGDAIDGKRPFTVVIEDPLASSYVQSYTAPAPDPQIKVEEYERTEEEEEDLGLKDIKTEDYGYTQTEEKKEETTTE